MGCWSRCVELHLYMVCSRDLIGSMEIRTDKAALSTANLPVVYTEVFSLQDKDTDVALTRLSSLFLCMYILKHHFVYLNRTAPRFKPFSWVNVVQVSPRLVTHSFLNLKFI